MTKNKEQYCSPNTKVLVVRFEGRIMTGSVTTNSTAMPSFIEDEEEDW